MLYGTDVKTIWRDRPPSPSDVSAWLLEHREQWTVRQLGKFTTINEITAWARLQELKRLDWDFIPKKTIWFRDPQVAILWDLSGPRTATKRNEI